MATFGILFVSKPILMKKENLELKNKIIAGIEKALKKLVENSAAKNESLVISGPNGEVLTVPAKELLTKHT